MDRDADAESELPTRWDETWHLAVDRDHVTTTVNDTAWLIEEDLAQPFALEPSSVPPSMSLSARLWNDQLVFYSVDSLMSLGLAFGVGGILANSDADQQIHKHFQNSVRGATTDEWFEFLHANKELGNGVYTIPIMTAAWLIGSRFNEYGPMERLGTWGERSMRGFVVGAPPLLLMQLATGGGRPGETHEGSEWQPFADNNGVSGHAFMSSLPFITAAKMTENRLTKTLLYTASTFGPLSRVNDNAHYPSQVILGWSMAYLAASAVVQTDSGRRGWSVVPNTNSVGSGLALQYRW